MYVFELPEIGEGVVEGEIVQWLTNVGEFVDVDQPLCEVMTDKANVEISSPKSGVVRALHGDPGDIVPVHSPLVDIDTEASAGATAKAAPPKKAAAPKKEAPKKEAPKKETKTKAPAPKAVAAPTPAAPAASAVKAGGKTLATPAVRSYAREHGLDLATVPGSGKDGRVSKADIDSFMNQSSAIKAPAALEFSSVQAPGYPRADETVKIIGLRRKIAEKMVESYRTIPHFTYVEEVDATRLVGLRGALKGAAADKGIKLSYLPFIMKALVSVFREFPTVNANMDEGSFALNVRGEVNIGIATDTPQGLYVPVIKNVESKSILQLAHEVIDITERTRNGTASIDDFRGGTFTITSVGNIGGRFATPIINHPEVAILGVNQIHDRPMVIDGEIVARKMMYLSPSFDHRVIDGAVGARFVAALKALLETPEVLLVEGL
jgi:pyruvate/2-oxoglutarate dehydrogenase complex dihydrolipoamide acyltransferase (E2) component